MKSKTTVHSNRTLEKGYFFVKSKKKIKQNFKISKLNVIELNTQIFTNYVV